MKYVVLIFAFAGLVSCSDTEEVKETPQKEVREDLVVVKDGIFTEYYPGKKKIKFQGPQDEGGQRHGIWYFYGEDGTKISMTEYNHGKKNGVSLVRYQNGAIQYTGEYQDDKQVGIWKTYDPSGKLVDSTNYDALNEREAKK